MFMALHLSSKAQQNARLKKPSIKQEKNVDVTFSDFEDNEEKVVISIVNFGRKNPFKPYSPARVIKSNKDVFAPDDIPLPPEYKGADEISHQASILLNSKVNGILYDPSGRSVAIVNLNGFEYMLHKGDIVENIEVNAISKNSVTLKYGNNSYTVSVGEVIEGSIAQNTVQRSQNAFGGYKNYMPESDHELPDINLEEYAN